jgi:phosphoribosylformimino-5-aminoimidazole carboxamide ribotide isomerase
MRFRPCIDLHQGVVKQIVGATLSDKDAPQTNFTASQAPSHFAQIYRRDGLEGGHVIMLGPGNCAAAAEALAAFPEGLQLGGGMTADNAESWLKQGAAGIIVTSYVFKEGRLLPDHLEKIAAVTGQSRLVLDLSCARRGGRYVVCTDRWQRDTDFEVNATNLEYLSAYCHEFLVHATQVEGRQQGIDAELVRLLGDAAPVVTTYAGGIRNFDDIDAIDRLGGGRLDFTVGSALDIFGGDHLRYADLVAWGVRQKGPEDP